MHFDNQKVMNVCIVPRRIDYINSFGFDEQQETEFPQLLTNVLNKITSDSELKRIQKIIADKRLESKVSVKTALEAAQLNIQWSNRNIPAVKSFLTVKKSGAPHQATISFLILCSSVFIAFYQ